MSNPLHTIHSRAGRIGGRADTSPSHVDRIVTALAADGRKHLVLHFHGGLVSKEAGMATAKRLLEENPVYSPTPASGGYPVFYVWESGVWETIRNNLTELAGEPVFRQLLRKLVQYALEELGGEVAAGLGRSVSPASRGSRDQEVRQAFERFWSAPGPDTVPYRGYDLKADASEARAADGSLDEDEILADLEGDQALQNALATLPDASPSSRSALGAPDAVEHRSAFSELAAAEFSSSTQTRGLIELLRVARFLVKVLRAVLSRRAAGRDHGLYATCVEEVVRAFRVAGSGLNEWGKALQWNRMKQDTLDAFGPDPDLHAGTALLARLGKAMKSGQLDLKRLTLVGHSTGAIYIAHWLAHSAAHLPAGFRQDVVFLAPAISFELWDQTVRQHGHHIGHFRMFAMADRFERDDQVWGSDEELGNSKDWRRYVYPSSLLYLVSGILESRTGPDGLPKDEADVPLLGMARFLEGQQVYDLAQGFGDVQRVRQWGGQLPGAWVWSQTQGAAAGLNCMAIDHGAFDNDTATLESLGHLVVNGF